MKRIVKNVAIMTMIVTVMAVFAACGSGTGEGEKGGNGSGKPVDANAEKDFAEKMILPEDLGTTEDLKKFATIDLYGNPVGHEVFADYEYTIIDVWGTYCDPCIRAMPDMKKVYDAYKDKGINVMGMVIDVQEADRTPVLQGVLNARTIVETQEADFTHMLVPTNLLYSFLGDVQFIPTQFLVDSEGAIVSEFFKGGKNYDDWCTLLDKKLEKK